MKSIPINKLPLLYYAIVLILITSGLFTGCAAKTDDNARLQQLLSQRRNIDKEISEIEQRMAAAPDATEKNVPSVNVIRLEQKPFAFYLQVRGKVESDNTIFVPAQRPYIVTKIHVDVGEYVSRGQLLAELDNSSILQSLNEIEKALELATTLYERQKNLYDKKIGTEVQYLQAKHQVEDLEIKLKNVKTELEKTRIYSPISGMVDQITLKEGEAAIPNAGAIRVANLSALKVKAKISENMITQVKRGDKVTLSFPTGDVTLESTINSISKVIDPNNRTFDVEVLIPDNAKINPNMLAVLSIKTYENQQAIAIPLNAVQKNEKEQFVMVASQKSGRWLAEIRKITTGQSYENWVEVSEGLNEGDVVITFGMNNVTLGEPVNPKFSEL